MLKIRYISYRRISALGTQKRIDIILDHIKNNNIIIIDGRLKSKEEAELIRRTMHELSKDFEVFHGIEMASIYDNEPSKFRLKNIFTKESSGITIIGPASIIAELKQHQDYVEIKLKTESKK